MKNRNGLLLCVFSLAALLLPAAAIAQNPGNGGTTYSDLQVSTRPEDFLAKFIALSRAEVAANALLSDALGMADAAAPATSALQGLDLQATSSEIGKGTAAAGATHQRLTQALATPIALGDDKKAAFASGALALTEATRDFLALTRNIGVTKQALMMTGAPARVALYAARSTPELTAQLRTELKAVVAFASSNKIALAPEVLEVAALL